MLELALIVTLLVGGVLSGALLGATTGIAAIAALLAFTGGCIGTIFAYVSLAIIKRTVFIKRSVVQRPREFERDPTRVHTNFRVRLANYLKLSEQEVLLPDPYTSKMPFWTIVDTYWRRATRTANEFHATLLRIRELLNSSS